jgi:tRNA G18 (ribose-2'-O)-methylase SpoU
VSNAGQSSVGDHGVSEGLADARLGVRGVGRDRLVGLPRRLQGDGLARSRRAQARSTRGYFGIVAWHTKTPVNVGTLWRSASIFGAAFVATIGKRYVNQASDTMKTTRHTPLFHFADEQDFWDHIPHGCVPVAVEITDRARDLTYFRHPESAVYVLGPEDGSLPDSLLAKCQRIVSIPGTHCLNLAVAGSIVLYDRVAKHAA